jgi:hypothetical protein
VSAVVGRREGASLLVDVNLSGSAIGDAGAVALADALRSMLSLERLSVANCGVTDAGAVALAGALRGNTALLRLSFHNNAYGRAGEDAMSDALAHNHVLAALHVDRDVPFELVSTTLESVVINGTLSRSHRNGALLLCARDDAFVPPVAVMTGGGGRDEGAFAALPDELLVAVLSRLGVRSLVAVAAVSRRLRRVAYDAAVIGAALRRAGADDAAVRHCARWRDAAFADVRVLHGVARYGGDGEWAELEAAANARWSDAYAADEAQMALYRRRRDAWRRARDATAAAATAAAP